MAVVTGKDVSSASARSEGWIHRTPVLSSRTLDRRLGASVLLKCENFQRAGAFKIRGAFHAISRLTPEQRQRGVCTHSSGNHAQAVALAARMLDTHATILMPSDAPESKIAAVRDYGGAIQFFDRYRDDRHKLCARLADESGSTIVPPYDHPDIIAGQGTVVAELWEQAGPLDALVAPLGGGGLMAGSAVAATERCPDVTLFGVEPAEGDDHQRSLAAGHRVSVPVPRTVADGLAVNQPGELTFEINRRLVSEVVTVPDDAIVTAMRWLFDRMKLVVEPSGAAPIAALLSERIRLPGHRIGVVVSGGNVSAERFGAILSTNSG